MPFRTARSSVRMRSPIGRSLDIYYRDTARTKRMDRLNATLIGSGQLVFDIGAHVGDRTDSFSRLGASVVALEPQPRVFRALRLILGRRFGVTLRNQAVGATCGNLEMFINSANPTVSTASKELIAAAGSADTWQGQNWDATAQVSVTTLDMLIVEFGIPDFVKIDVEGFELEVLKGLRSALPLLSFEFTTIQRDVATACIDYVSKLGQYKFNYSLGEEHQLRSETWLGEEEMRHVLWALPSPANSGDIFAKRFG